METFDFDSNYGIVIVSTIQDEWNNQTWNLVGVFWISNFEMLVFGQTDDEGLFEFIENSLETERRMHVVWTI